MPHDIHKRLIAGVATLSDENRDEVSVHFGDLIERLLLFETNIVESIRLKEIPHLVQLFGYRSFLRLLRSGRLKLLCQAVSHGDTGRLTVLKSREKKGPLPWMSYQIDLVQIADNHEYLTQNLQQIHKISGTTRKEQIKIKGAVADNIVQTPQESLREHMEVCKRDLKANDLAIRKAIINEIDIKHGISIKDRDLDLSIEYLSETEFRVESNLVDLTNLSIDVLPRHCLEGNI